jgi:hypothetical protein
LFIPHGKILHCLKLLHTDPLSGEQHVQQLLFPQGDPDGYWPMALKWLKMLPEYKKIEKICSGFDEAAHQAGARLSHLEWWDILPQTRHLMGTLQRANGVAFRILFIWKKPPDKDRETALAFPGSASWGRDQTAPGGWRFEIEGETYDHVMAAFTAMLRREVPPLPGHELFMTRISAFPQPVILLDDLLATR